MRETVGVLSPTTSDGNIVRTAEKLRKEPEVRPWSKSWPKVKNEDQIIRERLRSKTFENEVKKIL